MRHILIGVGLTAAAIALWPDFSNAETGLIPPSSLTGSGVPAIDAGYKKRHRSTYTSQKCANRDEIRDVARDALAEKYAVLSLSLIGRQQLELNGAVGGAGVYP